MTSFPVTVMLDVPPKLLKLWGLRMLVTDNIKKIWTITETKKRESVFLGSFEREKCSYGGFREH